MKVDFDKLISVIENSKNEKKHIPAIERMMKNFKTKCKFSTDPDRSIYVVDAMLALSRLLTRLGIE
jgi:hypothetical protein